MTLAVNLSGSTATQSIARLTFFGALTEGATSPIDGNYTLTFSRSQVNCGLLSGDNVSSQLRLFGDVNEEKAVNGMDLTASGPVRRLAGRSHFSVRPRFQRGRGQQRHGPRRLPHAIRRQAPETSSTTVDTAGQRP
jgi:hypothetical protein